MVSNRGPVVYGRGADGVRVPRRGGGGLVTALRGLVAAHDVSWVASALTEEDAAVAEEAAGAAIDEIDRAGNRFRLRLVVHDPAVYDRYYNVFANPMLWFLQHHLWNLATRPAIDQATWAAWEAYCAANRSLAEAAVSEWHDLGGADAVMVHDYQLYTAPAVVRDALPEAVVTHFTHIPWPDPDAWQLLPEAMRRGICDGMLASDVAGFHTERYARSFLRTCRETMGYHVDDGLQEVHAPHGRCRVRVYPISVDADEFDALADDERVAEAERRLLAERPERLVLRVDRTDPSKNIVRGFEAFDRFLQQHPEWHGRVRMLALLDPSRQEIPEYAEYLGAVQRAARNVGERWSGPDGQPAIDLRVHDNFPEVVAAYRQYDVLLVNALFDGMNLVAKEAPLVNARHGVLILSENAGAHAELGELALSVNPFDVQQQADAIATALELDEPERARRSNGICAQVRSHDVRQWIDLQLTDLDGLGATA